MTNKAQGWIDSLVDKDSFKASSSTDCLEVITGVGTVHAKQVAIYAQNMECNRGYISQAGAELILKLMEHAYQLQIPIVAFLASPGINIEQDLESGSAYSAVISKNISLSGAIPQFAVIMAPTLGAPAYSSILMDCIFFNRFRSFLMVTSPTVVKEAIGEKVTMADLGGAMMHAKQTGLADFLEKSVAEQIKRLKAIIGFFPSHQAEHPATIKSQQPIKQIPKIPSEPRTPFNMILLIEAIVDSSSYHQYKADFGCSMLCLFAYIEGYPVGIVANQSTRLSGAIDSDAAQKSARFIRLCDAYNIPIITLIDVPGFMPGKREEQRGLLRHGARFCAAMQTMVPRLSVVVRKCYGAAAFLMMQSATHGGDLVLALKGAQIGAMGQKASSKVQAIDKKMEPNQAESNESLALAIDKGLVDEEIEAHQIRARLAFHLNQLFYRKQKSRLARKHFIDP